MDTKLLRQRILDLAIQGKLVPQDPNDEPASILLERIHAEKEQLVKEGKLKKKDIANDSIIFKGDDNRYYEKNYLNKVICIEKISDLDIPNGWCFTRLSSYTLNRDGERKPISSAERNKLEKIYPYYGATGEIDRVENFIFDETLLLVGEDGANLLSRTKPLAYLIHGKSWVNNHAHCIDSIYKESLKYLSFIINSMNLDEFISGSAQPKLTQTALNNIILMIPPLKEQKRIVNKVNKLMLLVDVIEQNKKELDELKELAKSKVLDLAIQGKLVEQDPNDEPASVLLEKIREEKEQMVRDGKLKKKDIVNDSIIYRGDDNCYYEYIFENKESHKIENIPFDLPDRWCYTRLGSLIKGDPNSFADGPFGSNLKKEHYTLNKEVRIIQLSNIGELSWKNENVKYTSFLHAKTIERSMVKPGDIVIAKMMPAGRAIIVPNVSNAYILSSDCVKLRAHDSFDKQFIVYSINSSSIRNQVYSEVQGTTRIRTSINKLKRYLIAIPPLNEQLRISNQIKHYYKMLDEI